MDRNYIDDHHVVARYLADQLSDTEREAFEAYYLEHPEVLGEMEAAARFKVGLLQLRDSGGLDALMKPRPWYRQQRSLAIAASVAIVAIGAMLWFNRSPPAQSLLAASPASLTDRLGASLRVTNIYTILRTRGVSYDAEIGLPKTPQAIALRVLPEFEAQPASYRIVLYSMATDDALHEVATIGGLTAAADGFVPVYLNSASLKPGRYQLVLSSQPAANAADSSAFLIRITDDPS